MQKKWENEQNFESQTWPYEGCGLRQNFGLRMREFSFGLKRREGHSLEREPSWCDYLHLGFHLIKQKEARVKLVEEIKRFKV